MSTGYESLVSSVTNAFFCYGPFFQLAIWTKLYVNLFIFHHYQIQLMVCNIYFLLKFSKNKSLHIFNLLTSIDFLGLTETWHEDATSPSLLSASPSFHSFIELARSPTKPFSSSHSSYGGISLFYKSTFSAFNIHYPSYSSFECLFSSFKSPSNFTFVIALIDRPPTSPLPLFLEEFSVLTDTLYMHFYSFFYFR